MVAWAVKTICGKDEMIPHASGERQDLIWDSRFRVFVFMA
jgi:hypothetical protein